MTLQKCRIENIPGTPGLRGLAGASGTNGANAWGSLTLGFTMPAQGGSDVANLDSTLWVALGEPVFIEGLGTLLVTAISGTQLTLLNLQDGTGAYAANLPPGTVAPSTSRVTPTGWEGQSGTPGGGGASATASFLTSTVEAALVNSFNLGALTTGLLKQSVAAGVATPAIALDGTDYLSPSTGLANGTIGSTVQAFNALLAAIAGLAPTVADRMIYTTGVNTVAVQAITAWARTFLGASAASGARTLLDVLPGYGLLGSLTAVDLNVATSDNALTVNAGRFIIDRLTVDNASVNLTAATGGLFTAAGGGGTTLAADQVLSALTASTKYLNLILGAVTGTDVVTTGTLYFRVGTPQGVAATANVRLFGWKLA